jgi:hypothetical protein
VTHIFLPERPHRTAEITHEVFAGRRPYTKNDGRCWSAVAAVEVERDRRRFAMRIELCTRGELLQLQRAVMEFTLISTRERSPSATAGESGKTG